MYAQLLGWLLFFCQIIINESSFLRDNQNPGESSGATSSPALPEGYVTFPEDHAAYKIHLELVKWDVARDRCISEGGRLAVTDSFDKVVHINSIKRTSGKWVHVGIHRLPGSDEWVRVDNGLPPKFVPWMAWVSPNSNHAENCAGLATSEHGLAKYACDVWNEYFVCEIPI